ncbi:carboxymuconolactone decarboxylase family protein [Mucilaginibacter sp. UR6-11]|uniref:carboxymuconolactone decarboxylase family protein n=1 Tax=Mucilaginibacter sp. UR6-11 TaxID=1435644 RepID=UPI001E455331|nr:carboxymuconolactone decarboxylase family protein [Mucilaginibacter sp. UR6-11]MCC8426832.1 carboxymuconolactone decarboxylase family protein [Mucilaginibacter sp. UR6-11]
MSNRINVLQSEPDAYKAIMGLENYIVNSGISKTHLELIKIRASQINGCAYCLDMHTRDARKAGETEQRIYVLNAWRDTSFFTEEEKAILALTEEVTLISKGGVADQTYQQAAALFDGHYLAKVIMAITVINAWNRISISARLEPKKEALNA